MEFKYQNTFDELALSSCPPQSYEAKENNLFRWIYEKGHADNFLPQYFKNPTRFISKADKEKCSSLGLSFFDSQEQAQARFLFLPQNMGEQYL